MLTINPDWYRAIFARRSRRNYDPTRKIEKEIKQRLDYVCNLFHPYDSARVIFISDSPDDIFANAIGFYSNIKHAPAFLAFIGNTGDPHMQEKVGYTGQGLILEATLHNLATCWVALTYNSRTVKSLINPGKDEKLIAVSPVGYSLDRWSFEEKLYSGFGSNHKRRDLSDMVRGLPADQWPSWIRAGLEAARLAPSAINRQPWVFDIHQSSISILERSTVPEFNVSRRLDCGIAMLHLELGALSRGCTGKWEFLDRPAVAKFLPDKYDAGVSGSKA